MNLGFEKEDIDVGEREGVRWGEVAESEAEGERLGELAAGERGSFLRWK